MVLALISLPTYLPSCMAGCATPGSLFSETMSPIANTSGCPARVQSGFDRHPAGPVDLDAGLLGEHPGQRSTPAPRRPRSGCGSGSSPPRPGP